MNGLLELDSLSKVDGPSKVKGSEFEKNDRPVSRIRPYTLNYILLFVPIQVRPHTPDLSGGTDGVVIEVKRY